MCPVLVVCLGLHQRCLDGGQRFVQVTFVSTFERAVLSMKRSTLVFYVAVLSAFFPFVLSAQTPPANHKPVLVSYSPRTIETHLPNVTYKFLVVAHDPDGDTLIYSWKVDRVLVQSSRDSTYTMMYTDPLKPPHGLACVFSEPGGLKDSITWSFDYLAVPGDPGSIAVRCALEQNYPNPFNPSTTIRYELPQAVTVSLKIFNALGELVATLVDEHKAAGFYQVQWNALNVPSGIYFYRLHAGEYSETRKLLLIK